ncbi:MAG: Smr/MutS family protein [Polyangiaceae bacterium]|nr:Smr/MutS family protein [Polyangiaceae bacterium]
MNRKNEGKAASKKPFNRPFQELAHIKLPPSPPNKPAPRPVPPRPEPSSRGESFAALLVGVKPLSREAKGQPPPTPPAEVAAEEEAARDRLRTLVSGGKARFEIHDDGLRIEGKRLDVDPKVFHRLRRGNLIIDLRCDLHGLTAAEARARLEDVLPRARQRGERVLLLIHGKGHNSPGGKGVLRGEMAAWLSQGPASVHVAAFTTATPKDGGEGAVYVLLRDKQQNVSDRRKL